MSGQRDRVQGLYGVTPDVLEFQALEAAVASAIAGGMRTLQYRAKALPSHEKHIQARRLLNICKRAGVAFLVNDDLHLAKELDADGVHLGRDDASLEVARAVLGAGKFIGVSCYNELALARKAATGGADYIAFGSFFSSPTKPQAPRAGPSLIRQAKQELDVPVVAIGGITLENASQLIDAGADALAVISDLFMAADIAARAHQFNALFENHV